MNLLPFTPSGVQQKQTELYALPDHLLTEQAVLIRGDLRLWVKDNFSLETDQITYLNNLDNRWLSYTSCQVSFAVENRLSISLIVFNPPGVSKLIRTQPDLTAAWSPGSGFEVNGSLTIEVVYQ